MFITVINDCRDENAVGRQTTRLSAFFNSPINFIGVNSDLEAAGNLVDCLDAGGKSEGIILVNVAPRNGNAKKWNNGTPFGYFYFKNILIISSIDGLTLTLIKKLKLTTNINVIDIKNSVLIALKNKLIDKNEAEIINSTQFRSYEFLPRAALWLKQGIKLSTQKMQIKNISDVPNTVWWIDNFGNCKTTLLYDEINNAILNRLKNKFGNIKFYKHLKDVPDKKTALVIGSSGIKNKKFLEIIIQGNSAAKKFKAQIKQKPRCQ